MKISYYQDILLRPGEEAPLPDLQSALYDRLHMLFVKAKNDKGKEYALAFPMIEKKSAGRLFRVFSESLQDLVDLDIPHICMSFYGAMDFRSPKEVPQGTPFVRYRRVHDGASRENRISRIERTVSDPERRERLITACSEKKLSGLPFVWMSSSSSSREGEERNRFPLLISKEPADMAAAQFNCYGLPLEEGGVPDFR